jgi:hypothetical protein
MNITNNTGGQLTLNDVNTKANPPQYIIGNPGQALGLPITIGSVSLTIQGQVHVFSNRTSGFILNSNYGATYNPATQGVNASVKFDGGGTNVVIFS